MSIGYSSTSDWKINCDGYWPYCGECGFEPARKFVSEYGLTKICPKCGRDMITLEGREYKEYKDK